MFKVNKILLLAGLITIFGFFYFAIGANFELDGSAGVYGVNLLFYLAIIFLQFIPHLIILLILNHTYKNKPKNNVSLFIWGYVIIACALNIIIIRFYSKEKRAQNESQQKWDSAEKYFYSIDVSCPVGYPISIVSGGLSNDYYDFNGDLNKELFGTDNYEWGKGESGIYSAEYVLPDSLKLTWCSLIEKRFYTINVALDKKKIETLFRKDIFRKSDGITSKEKYNEIVLGFQPGGNVAVWLNFCNENSIEIGFYKARKSIISEIPSDSIDYYIDKILERSPESEWIKTTKLANKIQFDNWSIKYRKKYNWRFQTNNNLTTNPSQIRIEKYNGEIFEIQNENLSQVNYTMNTLPRSIFIQNIKIQGKTTDIFANFNEDNIYSVFEKLDNDNHTKEISIICTINNKGRIENIIAKNDLEKIKLKITTD